MGVHDEQRLPAMLYLPFSSIKEGFHLNQNDLIQKIIAAEHQAQALTENARQEQENMESGIQQEIAALRARYQAQADSYLENLKRQEQEKSAKYLSELDLRLQAKLAQIDSIYAAQKDAWIDAIFERIVGKAGG